MAINYPSSLDSFPNPTSTDLLDNSSPTLDHWTQHSNVNDAIAALEAKVGANSSAVTTSHDYKLSEVTSTDKAVGKTATQTLTNKTLTSPVINVGSDAIGDMYYRNSLGAFTRLPAGTSNTILNIDSITGLPTWTTNPTGADASTTSKGVVELATYAETVARTTTGGTGAKLVPTPDVLPSVLAYDYQADSVGTDSYAITCSPAPTAYTTGMRFTFKAGTANTGSATLNVNSLGAKTIKKNYNSDLSTGDILANQIIEVVYDGTNMQMVSQKAGGAYSSGTTTKNANDASATQTIAHGLGVTPKYVRIKAVIALTSTSGVDPGMYWAETTYNGTTQSSISVYKTSATVTAVGTTFLISSTNTGDTANSTGVVTVDATNISIAWTKTGSPGTSIFTILWEAQA